MDRRSELMLTIMLWLMNAGWAAAQEPRADTKRIEEITGLKGTLIESEGVFKVTSAREDVKVAVDRWALPPFMGLTTWASFFLGHPNRAMVMGDLVLFQDEVNPVLSELLEAGLEVTALHNHFFFDEPRSSSCTSEAKLRLISLRAVCGARSTR